jgi:hypothetical protein
MIRHQRNGPLKWLLALLIACFLAAFAPTASAVENGIWETACIVYDAPSQITHNYDVTEKSSSEYNEAARPPGVPRLSKIN